MGGQSDRSPDPGDAIRQLSELASELRAEHVRTEAESLAERLAEGRFFVACVGQFKRGKSTVLNALVGDAVLPMGVVPVTAIVTVLRHGVRRAARLRRGGGAWEDIDPATLAAYVTEEQNPHNRKRVDGVEVFVPSPLLASGLCLVDTPGLGSVFASNARVTRQFVPHVDAALVVFGADPPISGEEVGLVEEVARQTDRLLFVLNKADRLSNVERAEARRFTERVLEERLRRPVGRVYEVSATERLAGAPTRDWEALEGDLAALSRESGARLVEAAAERGIARLGERLLAVIDEYRDTLLRPIEESEQRVAALRATVAEAERALKDLSPLFTAEQVELARELEREKQGFLAGAVPAAVEDLVRALAAEGGRSRRPMRGRAMGAARVIASRRVEAWLRDVEPRIEELYRRATTRFVELANGFLARLKASGDAALARLPVALPSETTFRAGRRFHFTDLLVVAAPSPLTWLVDRLGPGRLARIVSERDAREYLARLLETNGARVANDLADRVGESRRRLEAEIVALLQEIATSAERALEHARVRHGTGAAAVRDEVERLETRRGRLERLLAPRSR